MIRIHLTFYILLFLAQEIFSAEETTPSESDNNSDNKIRCKTACLASIFIAGVLIITGIVYAIYRIQKRNQRQKTGHTEIVEKFDDANLSFETINTQPVFQNPPTTQDHAKTS